MLPLELRKYYQVPEKDPGRDPYCVLYAPLWKPKSRVSPFLSQDRNRHTITNTGSTWGSQGYTLDGNDYLSLPVVITSAMWQGSADFTAMGVAKTTAFTTASQTLIGLGQAVDAFTYARICFRTVTYSAQAKNRLEFGVRDNTNKADVRYISDNNTNLIDNTIYHWAITQIGGTLAFYINGVSVGIVNDFVGARNGASFANQKTLIGARSVDAVETFDSFLAGAVGEVSVYNISTSKAMQHYLSAKRRIPWLP